MNNFISVLGVMSLTIVAALSCAAASFAQNSSEYQYEVLSPWADVDPVPVRGISPRVDTLSGKKIGLLLNEKRAARPIQEAVEKKLKEHFPGCETSFYQLSLTNALETETNGKDKFTAWAKDVDAVIAAVGD